MSSAPDVTAEDAARDEWGDACAALTGHQDSCPDCLPGAMCPKAQPFIDREQAAWRSWRAARGMGVVS